MTKEFQSRIIALTDLAQSEAVTSSTLIQLTNDISKNIPPKEIIHLFLDLAHFPNIVKVISNSEYRDIWFEQICNLIDKSQYHVGILLKLRSKLKA